MTNFHNLVACMAASVFLCYDLLAITAFTSQPSKGAKSRSHNKINILDRTLRCQSYNRFIQRNVDDKSSIILSCAQTSTVQGLTNNALTWYELLDDLVSTPTGKRLQHDDYERSVGLGPPHVDSKLRLFTKDQKQTDTKQLDFATESENPRVTLYRDDAGWCPYCQKVWIFLEEKCIPYRVQKVPLNAYGDKPAWFTRKVDGGKLPAVELDGKLYTESFAIMELLYQTFADSSPKMVSSAIDILPDDGYTNSPLVEDLLDLEQKLQSSWFSLVFYPVEGDDLDKARTNFLHTIKTIDDALNNTKGPWFLGGDAPSIIDILFITIMERIIASVLYFKGVQVRDTGEYKYVDRWIHAFEQRPSYMATKSDFYTLIKSIPSQNGPGYLIDSARSIADQIDGIGNAWTIPQVQSMKSKWGDTMTATARHEAAYKVIMNHHNITHFAARGAGEPGQPSFHAELSDPYAEPNEDYVESVDICLRHVTAALIYGLNDTTKDAQCSADDNYQSSKHSQITCAAQTDMAGKAGTNELRENWYPYKDDTGQTYYWNEISGESTYTPPTQQLDTCLSYLRDRIGVPRDMTEPAAIELRAYLNWAIQMLQQKDEE